jgi:hypothetical protein
MILEFNRSDKYLISSLGNEFTISLEFELETNDLSGKVNISKERFIDIIKEQSLKFIITNNKDLKYYTNLVDEIVSELSLDDDFDDDDNYEIINDYIKSTKDKFEKDLYRVIYSDYLTYWCSDNIEYLTDKVKENLPIFYKKWNNTLKFELDNTLERGIEFSPKKYLNSIDETLDFIEDFYKDFENQEYWYMSKRTGIHINIGLKKDVDWNILKGFLMISDDGEKSFTFKNMEWRQKSSYTQTFLPQLKKDILLNRNKVMKKTQFDDLKKLEDFFGKFILSKMEKHGYKNYGFNITRINDYNYVEFRYPGGNIEKDILIDKIYYFCYVVKLMTDESFKRKQYLNKLYKFISSL